DRPGLLRDPGPPRRGRRAPERAGPGGGEPRGVGPAAQDLPVRPLRSRAGGCTAPADPSSDRVSGRPGRERSDPSDLANGLPVMMTATATAVQRTPSVETYASGNGNEH